MCPALQLGQIANSRQKLDFLKIVKLTDNTCAYNSLTNFECKAHMCVDGKDERVKVSLKNSLTEWFFFWRVFSPSNLQNHVH